MSNLEENKREYVIFSMEKGVNLNNWKNLGNFFVILMFNV